MKKKLNYISITVRQVVIYKYIVLMTMRSIIIESEDYADFFTQITPSLAIV